MDHAARRDKVKDKLRVSKATSRSMVVPIKPNLRASNNSLNNSLTVSNNQAIRSRIHQINKVRARINNKARIRRSKVNRITTILMLGMVIIANNHKEALSIRITIASSRVRVRISLLNHRDRVRVRSSLSTITITMGRSSSNIIKVLIIRSNNKDKDRVRITTKSLNTITIITITMVTRTMVAIIINLNTITITITMGDRDHITITTIRVSVSHKDNLSLRVINTDNKVNTYRDKVRDITIITIIRVIDLLHTVTITLREGLRPLQCKCQ